MMRPLRYWPWWLALGLAYVALILWASLTSLPVSTGLFGFDKVQHFLGYFLLSGWFCALFLRRWHLVILLAAVALGALMEFAQAAGGVRAFELFDIVANTLGAAFGFALIGWTALRDVFVRIEQRLG